MKPLATRTNKPELNNAGFTLLEIIAVIVIMSILAVVAVPRYFDLQTQARQRAMDTGLAEGIGRVNGYFAQQVLTGTTPSAILYDTSATRLGSDLGDFILTVSAEGALTSATHFRITVTGRSGTPLAGMTKSADVKKPGL